MILMIDNYDSFTYNVVQLIEKLGYRVKTVRNDQMTLAQIERIKPSHIVISPGPGRPTDAGISLRIIKKFSGKIPILGVCLGHQCIAEAFGGKIISANKIVHGKTSKISHDNKGLFRGLPQNFSVVRYHSLAVDQKTLPDCLEISAMSVEDDTIMGIRHKEHQVVGVQFHPESIGTELGEKIMTNFFFYKTTEGVTSKLIAKVASGIDLTGKESYAIMDEITNGELSDSQLGAFLGALNAKGITAQELTYFVKVLRDKTGVKTRMAGALDTCGTGGDGRHTFNFSTAAALIAASAGVKVAKHGNKAVSSKSGSFDFLNHIGIRTDGDIKQNVASIEENNFAFFFAPKYHSAMRHVGKVRQELKMRTVFNMMGPLANPLPLTYQLVGVFEERLLDLFADSMKQLGRKRAMVVFSKDGLDEISICAPTMARELKMNGTIVSYEIDPQVMGIRGYTLEDIRGNSPAENVEIFQRILCRRKLNRREKAIKCGCALNAGAALYISGKAKSIQEGYCKAIGLIESGKVKRFLSKVVQYANV